MTTRRKHIPRDVKEQAVLAFPEYTFSAEVAPQGQNSFCFNFILNDTEGRRYLLKAIRLSRTEAENPDTVITEVEASRVVRSPYFASLRDSRRQHDCVFLLFDYLHGNNLSDFIQNKQQAFSEQEVIEIGIHLLRGISDLARAGIRHQDIKPENIFITDDNQVKILDFGSARFRQPTFRGSTKTNRLYSAPEQLYASKPGALEMLRLTCDERSDVYSVGCILYLLLTGSVPFASNREKLEHQIPPAITREDISAGLKKVISRMLNPKMRNRPNATIAISFLENNDVTTIRHERGKFFYQASASLEKMHAVLNHDENAFDGIVIDASKLPKKELEYIKNGPLTTIIDPQVYLLQRQDIQRTDKFKALPYMALAHSNDVYSIENIQSKEDFIKEIYKYQQENGADYLMPPFFCLREVNEDSWVLDAEVMSQSLAIYDHNNLQLPLLKGVAVSETMLESSTTRGRLLDHLTNTDWAEIISGYYVLLENGNSEGLPNAAWLKAAREFITDLLATGKEVIWGHAQLPSILYSHSGVSLCMGENASQRKFDMSSSSGPGPRTPSPHMYLPSLIARIKWTSGMQLFNAQIRASAPQFYCHDSCCAGIDFTNPSEREQGDLLTHMVLQLSKQFRYYSDPTGSQREREDIQRAIEFYDSIRSGTNTILKKGIDTELKPPSKTMLEGSLEAFHSA